MSPVKGVWVPALIVAILGLADLPGPPTGFVAGVSPVSAQEVLSPLARGGVTAGAGATFQVFAFSEEERTGIRSISLLSVPLAGRVALADRLRFEVHSHWAQGWVERADGSETTIEGPTDTQLRASIDLIPRMLTVTGFTLLPTGVDAHSAEELELAGAMASDLLPFRISHWSAGGGSGAAVTFLRSFGRTGLGADVGFMLPGEFDLGDEVVGGFRPGEEFRASAVLDRLVGPAGKLTLRVDGRFFGDSELEGENVFRSGDRIGATGSYSFPVGPGASAMIYGGYRHRTEGVFLMDLEDRPSQGVALAGGALRTPGLGGVLTPSVAVRALRRDDGLSQGYGVGLGAGGEWGTGWTTVLPSLRVHFGSVQVTDEASSGFVGADLSLQIRFQGGHRR